MQETHDYLGIERLLINTLSEVEAYQPSPDDFQCWNDHPITIRMKKQIAAEVFLRKINATLGHNLEVYRMADMVLSYGIEGKSND